MPYAQSGNDCVSIFVILCSSALWHASIPYQRDWKHGVINTFSWRTPCCCGSKVTDYRTWTGCTILTKLLEKYCKSARFQSESGDGTWGRAEFAGARRSVCKIPTSV